MKGKLKRSFPMLICIMYFCTLFPMSAVAYSGLSLNRTSVILAKGETFSLKDTRAGNESISWRSSKSSVASVDQNGKIKAKKAGKATITASVYGVEKTCSVTVKSSKKSAALANYKAFLEQDWLEWGSDAESRYSIAKEHCGFQLIYVDNDSVPELAVTFRGLTDEDDVIPRRGYLENMFTYRNGIVLCIGGGDRFQYYPKKGVFAEVYTIKGFKSKYYYKLSKGNANYLIRSAVCVLDEDERIMYGYVSEFYEDNYSQKIDKSTFKKRRKKYVGSTKRKDVKEENYRRNTSKNRKKYFS